MIKKMYDNCVNLAGHKNAKPFLAFFSFIESSFFPIPPDVMIIPMTVAKKKNILKFFSCHYFLSSWCMFGLFHRICFFQRNRSKNF